MEVKELLKVRCSCHKDIDRSPQNITTLQTH